jgi:hypothetical protein
MNDLIPLEKPDLPLLFSPGGLSALLDRIEAEARSMVPNSTTDKGRKTIASMAAKVARSKTYIDGLGKDFVAGLKTQAAVVDAERKHARDRLDVLKEEIRRPLTEWETAEKARVAGHEERLNHLRLLAHGLDGISADDIRQRIAELSILTGEAPEWSTWDEFADHAARLHESCLTALTAALARREQYDAEQAELARWRAEAVEREKREAQERIAREQQEREERIAREAAEHAKLQAEAAARAEAKRQQVLRDAEIAKANQERIDAERRAAQAEERARLAAEQERKRAADEIEAEEREEMRRQANKKHADLIHGEVVAALETICRLSREDGITVMDAIRTGKIAHITITY